VLKEYLKMNECSTGSIQLLTYNKFLHHLSLHISNCSRAIGHRGPDPSTGATPIVKMIMKAKGTVSLKKMLFSKKNRTGE